MIGGAARGGRPCRAAAAPVRVPALVVAVLVGTVLAPARLLWAAPDQARADRELLDRLARETGVHTAPPAPSLHEYLATVSEAVFHRLLGWIHLPNLDLSGLGPVVQAVAYALAILLIAGALFLIGRLLLAAVKRRREGEGASGPDAFAAPVSEAPPSDAAYWWRRFRAAVKAGDSATAMESLWFWVAVRLTGTAVDPSWTSRELLERVGRDDLRPAMTQLDGWRYGPTAPAIESLEGLAAGFGEVLG